jgi:hypothetical protein
MKPYYCSLENLPGLSQPEQAKLKAYGINNTQELLEKTKTIEAKQKLAVALNINLQYIHKWVALADLARLPSVNYKYCGLLLHSGIISVVQLKENSPNRIHRLMLRLEVSTLQKRNLCPNIEVVQAWIKEANLLDQLLGK